MVSSLTIVRYKKRYIPFAFLAMAIFHLPLRFKKSVRFYKLMGSGRNGTFDKVPDLQQWAILAIHDFPPKDLPGKNLKGLYGSFIAGWFKFFNGECFTFFLQPVKGHGTWDGKERFSFSNNKFEPDEPVATLTRATIRLSKMKYFWQNVASAANEMDKAPGFIFSAGIGEVPWIKQATFSIWSSEKKMNDFAYGMRAHAEIVKKTRKEKWYSEDMFVRFRVLHHFGTIRGVDPLQGKA